MDAVLEQLRPLAPDVAIDEPAVPAPLPPAAAAMAAHLSVRNLAQLLDARPVGRDDAPLFAFVARYHVAIEPPARRVPVWHVQCRVDATWVEADAPDLDAALVHLMARVVALRVRAAAPRPMGVA